MEHIEGLVHWAKDHGIQFNGVYPSRIANRGVGVLATRKLEAGDIIMTIPMAVARSIDTVPKQISQNLESDISIQGTLAAHLALDGAMFPTHWRILLPKYSDFEATMPIMWPEELQALLPHHAKALLKKQISRFKKDWKICSKAFPNLKREDYLYAWLLVNTRTFYYESSTIKEIPWTDRLAFLPIADLFNHEDNGCKVSFSLQGYQFTADRSYQVGDEVSICYGEYCNDYLLCEYGFCLSTNRWDKVCLDDVTASRTNGLGKGELNKGAFLRKDGLRMEKKTCRRPQIANRLLCCTPKQWNDFVLGRNTGKVPQGTIKAATLRALTDFSRAIKDIKGQAEKLDVENQAQKEVLVARWEQIDMYCENVSNFT